MLSCANKVIFNSHGFHQTALTPWELYRINVLPSEGFFLAREGLDIPVFILLIPI